MTKPAGAVCNLDCEYCYYLVKEELYPGSSFRMNRNLLAKFIDQYISANGGGEVTFAWQGGEPTLMGLDFFKAVVDLQAPYRQTGVRILNTLQTNGTRLDDRWGEFLKENGFLVGLSVDGPEELHDRFRHDKGGQGSFKSVMRGLGYLKAHGVETNILTTVNSGNQAYPLEVYRFLRDELGARYMQFIPIVETIGDPGQYGGRQVTGHSVDPAAYGRFLLTIYGEWVKRDVGSVYVQMFEQAFAKHMGVTGGLCVFEETCGNCLAMEHNGDVYACDHFVTPDYLLGNIEETHLGLLANSQRQREFGDAKRGALPARCQECEVRWLCNGGCPKDRFWVTEEGGEANNYLCEGYKAFFTQIGPSMEFMVRELRARRAPANVMREDLGPALGREG